MKGSPCRRGLFGILTWCRKTYYGGCEGCSLDLDFKRIFPIREDVNYNGYVTLEFGEKEDAKTAVLKSMNMLREAFRS